MRRRFLLFCATIPFHLLPFTDFNPLYRPPFFIDEPRFAKNHVYTFDAIFLHGETSSAFNSCHERVPALQHYGFDKLGSTTELQFQGTLEFFEMNLYFAATITHGLCLATIVPVRSMSIFDITLSPKKEEKTLNAILAAHSLESFNQSYHSNSVGDIPVFLGWTGTSYSHELLDFIDGTIAGGFLLPTGKKPHTLNVFALPLGFNRHGGFAWYSALAIGWWKWCTLGTYCSGIAFFNAMNCTRIRSLEESTGIINLGLTKSKLTTNPYIKVGTYFKADHFYQGLSFTVGYSYVYKGATKIKPSRESLQPYAHLNPQLQSWDMHVLQLVLDCDFATDDFLYLPHISFAYSQIIRGQRVFDSRLKSGILGLSLDWSY